MYEQLLTLSVYKGPQNYVFYSFKFGFQSMSLGTFTNIDQLLHFFNKKRCQKNKLF